jgi:hypothetical protein
VALIISGRTQVLLDDNPSSGVLHVERVLCILGHHVHAYMEVQALGVGYGFQVLLPHEVSLIASQEEHDWHRGGVGDAAPTEGSEGNLCRLLDSVV